MAYEDVRIIPRSDVAKGMMDGMMDEEIMMGRDAAGDIPPLVGEHEKINDETNNWLIGMT